MNRHKISLFLWPTILIACLVAGVIIWRDHWLAIPTSDGIAIHLVIHNRTGSEIGPFIISDDQSSIRLSIGPLKPLSAAAVDLMTSENWGENGIFLRDLNDRNYAVVDYFENSIRGRVDIRVECAGIEGLSGRYRVLTNYIFSTRWYSWGYPACK